MQHRSTQANTHTHTHIQRQWWGCVSVQVTLSVGWGAPAPCLQTSPPLPLPDPPRWFRRMSCWATTTCLSTTTLWVHFSSSHTSPSHFKLPFRFLSQGLFYYLWFELILSLSHMFVIYCVCFISMLGLFISFIILMLLFIFGLWQHNSLDILLYL